MRYKIKFKNTTYVVGNLILKLKKNVSVLIDVDYYQDGGINIRDDYNGVSNENNNVNMQRINAPILRHR